MFINDCTLDGQIAVFDTKYHDKIMKIILLLSAFG